MSLLQHSINLNSLANVIARPVRQPVNPNVEILTSKCSTNRSRLCNANESHALTNRTAEGIYGTARTSPAMTSAAKEHQRNRWKHKCKDAHKAESGLTLTINGASQPPTAAELWLS
jgi:hypothetical protein